MWRRDNSSPRERICSTEGRPIQERQRIPIARSKEIAMRWKCHGNISAEICFNLGKRSRRGGPNELVGFVRDTEDTHGSCFVDVNFAFFLVVLLFTFSFSEAPCPETFGGLDPAQA